MQYKVSNKSFGKTIQKCFFVLRSESIDSYLEAEPKPTEVKGKHLLILNGFGSSP